MKTFKSFITEAANSVIGEDYYRPNEKLRSGRTPVQNATRRGIKGELLQKVKRGADNRNFDTSHHPDVEITHSTDKNKIQIQHKKSGITYTARNTGKTKNGNTQYNLVWTHDKGNMSDSDAFKTGRDSDRVFKQHIAHRFPHDSVVHNNPLPNYKEKGADYVTTNPRAKMYQRWGFGKPQGNPDMPDQYAKVGRHPSPKQKAKGATRLKPISTPDED